MFCIASFLFLSILGLFSARYRSLSKEAFECAFRRVTFRACNTNFKEKMQARLSGKVLKFSPLIAKFLNKNFELLATLVLVLSFVSLFWTVQGLYNFYMYGSCNGLNKTGFCPLDPTGSSNQISGAACTTGDVQETKVTLKDVDLSSFPQRNVNSKDTVVLIGCFSCEYTRKAYPLIKDLIENNNVNFVFAHYPVKDQTRYLMEVGYCANKLNPEQYWTLNSKLFENSVEDISKKEFVDILLKDSGYNLDEVASCVSDPITNRQVALQRIELEKTGIYGTPLVFVNEQGLVGPKPYRVYNRMLNGFKFWK